MDKPGQCQCRTEGTRRCVRCAALARVRHVPDDFVANITRGMRSIEAAHLYAASLSTITRWRAETGTDKKTYRRAQKIGRRKNLPKKAAQITAPQNNDSPAAMAADFLRRSGPVSRCTENGVFSLTGDHWRMGSAILTGDDLIARAVRKGYVDRREK